MTTYKESQLPSVMKPCTICKGTKIIEHKNCEGSTCLKCGGDGVYGECPHCQGHGFEPVEMENPILSYAKDGRIEIPRYKHQVGVVLEVATSESPRSSEKFECPECSSKKLDVDCDNEYDFAATCMNCNIHFVLDNRKMDKFLPIRQKVEGDNSVLMVVKV